MKKKHFGNISKKGKVGLFSALFVMVLTAIMAFDVAGVRSLVAEKLGFMAAGDRPDIHKYIADNGDGTYKLSLDVTGDADVVVDTASNVNVLIVYDTSNSMTSSAASSSYTRADQAEDVVHDFIYDLSKYQSTSNPNNIEVALVTFARTGTIRQTNNQDWTSNLTGSNGVIRFFDDGGTDRTTNLSYTGNSSYGTNWQSALSNANTLLSSADGDPTFVIFVTDGAPTASGNGNNAISPNSSFNDLRPFYEAATTSARSIQTRENTTLYGIYAYGTEADLLDDLIYYSHNGSHRPGMNSNTNTNGTNETYFNAADTSSLNDAVSKIFKEIVSAMGVSSVVINDGTTQNVETSSGSIAHLLGVDESSYEYWLEIPVISKNGEYHYTDNDNNDITISLENGSAKLTWTDSDDNNHEATYNNASIQNLKVKFKWDRATDFYPKAPDAQVKESTDGKTSSVDWNLSSLDALLNGVKYTVTFDVYPTQETYDIIADLMNGEKDQAYLVENGLDDYIINTGTEANPSYGLMTNTVAKLYYDDTRTPEKEEPLTYDPITPAVTHMDTLGIKKSFPDVPNKDDWPEINIAITRDTPDGEEVCYDATLNNTTGYEINNIYIATGLAKTVNGQLVILDKGHDYKFAELGSEAFKWELETEVVRPMWIDGELVKLVLVDSDAAEESGKTYISIDGKKYVVGEGNQVISAENHSRSELHLTKTVNGENANPNDNFEFTMTVTQKDDEGNAIVDDSSTNNDDLWFSIKDKDGNYVQLDTTPENWTSSGNYYYAPNGTELVVNLKAGDNLRFTNLVSNTDFNIVEGDTENYKIDAIKTVSGFTSENDKADIDVDGKTIDGHIGEYNTIYKVEYTNDNERPETIDIPVEKKWLADDGGSEGLRQQVVVKLMIGEKETGDTLTLSSNNGWKDTFEGLLKYANGKEIDYQIKEVSVDHYSTEITGNKEDGFIVKNTRDDDKLINIPVEKQWLGDDDGSEGLRTSIEVELLIGTESTGQKLTLTKEKEWKDEFKDLAKYANGSEIDYQIKEVSVDHYSSEITGNKEDGFIVKNTRDDDKLINIPVEKQWLEDDNGSEGLRKTVEIELLIGEDPTGDKLTLTSEKGWRDSFTDLPKYANGQEIDYQIKEVSVDHYSSEITGNKEDGFIVKNTRDDDKLINIPVEKQWLEDDNGSEGLRTTVEIELLIGEEPTGDKLTLTEGNGWKDSFTDLPKYANGSEIDYQIKEVSVEHYTSEITGDKKDGFIVKNTRDDDKLINIPVEKQWLEDDNGSEGLRKEVTIELLNGTEPTGDTLTLTSEKNWKDSFTDLPKYANGSEIDYQIKEVTVEHYSSEITGNKKDGFIVKNTRDDDKLINIQVEKQWIGDDNGSEGLRTSVEVELLIGTESTGQKLTLTKEKEWKDEFKDLAKYADGKEIDYQIKEVSVDHYSSEITGNKEDGFIVKNTRDDDKTIDIPVEKVWENDEDGAEGLRTSVEVELLIKNADGSTTTTGKKLTLTEAKDWVDTFTNLAKYADGKEIIYSVKENTTNDHYTTEVSGSNTKLFVTNTRKDDKLIDIPVEKVWENDEDGAEGLRTSVEVELLIKNADGSTTTTDKKLTLTKEKGWIDSFTDLAKYADGELVHYTVKENTTNAHYTTEVSGNNTKLFVTNTRKDDKLINIPVEKVWENDEDGAEGLRTSVEVELLIGKESTGKKLTLTSEKSWKDEFKDLAKYANGQEIDYQIKEVKVDHYSTSITGDKTNGFIVKNTREDDKTIDIPVEKVWENDKDGAEGLRTSVEVELMIGENATGNKLTLTSEKNWKGTFIGVAKYANGQEIQYSIRENTTNDHYTVSVSGDNNKLIVTNTRKDDKYVSTSVAKKWDDKGDQDGIRPDTLNVVLSNGKTETVYQLKKADGWSLTVNNLPKYIDGKEATYTWSEPEANVPEGYIYVGKNTEGTTTTITNKHETDVTAVNVQKVWDDNDNQDGLRSAIEVELFKTIKDAMSGEDITSTTGQTATLSEDNNWFASFTGLDKNANGELILYSVVENTQLDGYNAPVVSDPINEGTITVTNKRDDFLTTSRTVKKVWHDDDNQDGKRPTELVVKLMDGTTEVGSVTLKESNNWTATIDGLPLNRGGSAINYTWAEFEMPDGYTLEDKTTEGLVTTITNKHESEIIPINVEKIWDNSKNTYGFTNPTEIKATLKDGETVLKEVPLNVDNNWKATFGNYPRYRDGSEILYTVEEESIGDYETVIEGSGAEGFTIKNTYIVQPINVIVEKSWKDNSDSDGQRPTSINVTLTGTVDGQTVYTDDATIEGTEKDTWSYTFENLPKTYFGKDITYSVTEEAVEGYEEPEYTGDITTKLVITNPYKTATVSYHVKKVWQEDDGYTGGRPESITVKLTANDGSEPRTAELSDSNNWYCEFNDLPKFMNHGEAITYTIEEVEVPETYESEPSIETEGDVSTVTITNTRATEIFWERIQKIWDDQDNKYGYRPKSIDVEVYANGELFDTFTLTAEDDWKLVITLPRYIDGVEAKYSIKEINVPEYITSIDGFTITNKLNHTEIVPPNTSVGSHTDGLMSVMVILGTFGILGYSVRKRYE